MADGFRRKIPAQCWSVVLVTAIPGRELQRGQRWEVWLQEGRVHSKAVLELPHPLPPLLVSQSSVLCLLELRRIFGQPVMQLAEFLERGLACGRRFGQGVSQVQFPEHRTFLGLVASHSPQDIIEDTDGTHDMNSLVQHHAFGPVAHGGVCNLSA